MGIYYKHFQPADKFHYRYLLQTSAVLDLAR